MARQGFRKVDSLKLHGKCTICNERTPFGGVHKKSEQFTFKCKCKSRMRKVTPYVTTNSNSCELEITLKYEIFCIYCHSSSEHNNHCIYKFHPNVKSDSICCVCTVENAGICLLPCSHSFCAECTFKMKDCAICREPKNFYCFKVQ